jgi:hypothetical protein
VLSAIEDLIAVGTLVLTILAPLLVLLLLAIGIFWIRRRRARSLA